ncbi:MAG TPA: hypothetical protein VNU28_03105 [Solirubrobacteraceae bacterium]|nr:hypothetical protein [Solirubrobacteraceae bacterium]
MRGTAFKHARAARAVLVLAGAFALLVCAQVAFASTGPGTTLTTASSDGAASVGIEQCVTSIVPTERSATFTAQMTATATTQKMAMRIELQERLRGESEFHTLAAPGFGLWRTSEPGVKLYKYVKQVTNLDAPAAYRVLVRFRWIGEAGHLLKRDELHTSRCIEPTLPAQVTQTPPATGA